MSIKIHHGPDGTFKTSGAIKDDIMTVIKSGRLLVTNVRGFSKEKTIQVLGEKFVHPDFDVIHIDTDSQEGRDKLARFFHWAPKGAFFVIDEVQRIFPPSWREKQLKELDYPENQDHLPEDERRPEDIHTAWDMQRHHNWDFIFTTTNIKKVHDMARVMAKVAVRHINLGIWRFYKTVEHDPESNGKTLSTQTAIRLFNYVPKQIFELYASTTTGSFENSEPRTAFYKDPKILFCLLFLVALGIYSFSKGGVKAFDKHEQKADSDPVQEQGAEVVRKKNNSKARNTRADSKIAGIVSGVDSYSQAAIAYLGQFNAVYLNGYSKQANGINAVFTGYRNEQEFQFSSDILKALNVKMMLYSECVIELTIQEVNVFIFCEPTSVQSPVVDNFTPPEIL